MQSQLAHDFTYICDNTRPNEEPAGRTFKQATKCAFSSAGASNETYLIQQVESEILRPSGMRAKDTSLPFAPAVLAATLTSEDVKNIRNLLCQDRIDAAVLNSCVRFLSEADTVHLSKSEGEGVQEAKQIIRTVAPCLKRLANTNAKLIGLLEQAIPLSPSPSDFGHVLSQIGGAGDLVLLRGHHVDPPQSSQTS